MKTFADYQSDVSLQYPKLSPYETNQLAKIRIQLGEPPVNCEYGKSLNEKIVQRYAINDHESLQARAYHLWQVVKGVLSVVLGFYYFVTIRNYIRELKSAAEDVDAGTMIKNFGQDVHWYANSRTNFDDVGLFTPHGVTFENESTESRIKNYFKDLFSNWTFGWSKRFESLED